MSFFLKMEELQEKCDIISFHTPLITKGPYPTFHLANKTFFNALKKATHHYQYKPGAVVDNTDVLQALKDGIIRDAIIDTWENEPNINQELLNLIYRNPAYRRLLRRRKSQCHPYGTHSIV